MKKKHVLIIALLSIIVAIALPVAHVLRTYYTDGSGNAPTPKGYTNDASGLNLTKIDSLLNAPANSEELIVQLRGILSYSRANKIPVSIAGAKHSMGGHTMYPDGIVVNMRPYKSMHIDTATNILTVGSGALWEEVIAYLNTYHKSVAVMQAFSSFSIGGSISVNGHGWQKNLPPVASSVEAFTLMNYAGEILTCSRNENKELFSLVLGGYGLFGIVLNVKLRVVENENLSVAMHKCKATDYLTCFKKYAVDDASVKLVFGRLNVSRRNFLENGIVNVFKSSSVPLPSETDSLYMNKSIALKRLVFRSSVNSEYGKKLRWNLETKVGEFNGDKTITRNELLNDNVALVENKDSSTTDILQEYFIPERNFNKYIEGLKKILPDTEIDLLNVTVRDVHKDNDSYLSYANEDVFGFVFLFNQKKNEKHEQAMKALTNKMVALAIEMEGTFYLPYRLHIQRNEMRKAYPQADSFFSLKLKYDPEEVFKNKFYDHYK